MNRPEPIDAATAMHHDPAMPFVERPWLLLLLIALLIGIVGHLLWHSEGTGANATANVIGLAVSAYLSVGLLIVPGLALRSARKAMRRLPAAMRAAVLLRLSAAGIVGPTAAALLWLRFGSSSSLGLSIAPELPILALCAFVMSLAGAAGLALQNRFRG